MRPDCLFFLEYSSENTEQGNRSGHAAPDIVRPGTLADLPQRGCMPVSCIQGGMQLIGVDGSSELEHDKQAAKDSNRVLGFDCIDRDLENPVAPAKHASHHFENALVVKLLQHFIAGKHCFCMVGGCLFQPNA